MKRICLLTGQPGTGKTSIIKEALIGAKVRAGGFYTEEIRSKGVRQGFKVVTLDGQDTILAHIDVKSPYMLSKYGVDIEGLERVGLAALHKAAQECDLVVIDEIGKMELFSENFRKVVLEVIESGKKVLGTIMLGPNPWADAVKRCPEVNLIIVTRNNYQHVLREISRWLEGCS